MRYLTRYLTRFLQQAVCAAAFLGAAMASAAPAEPKSGVEFKILPVAQTTEPGKKIEVIEFFAYYCPHCFSFEPVLAAWVMKQGGNIVFKRVHVPYSERTLPQQRLFFTLEAMGLAEQYHTKIFNAMHVDRLPLSRDEFVFDWVDKAGIDRAKFIDVYRSFGVQAKVRRADAMMGPYHVESWPMIAIDGRFLTSPSTAGEAVVPALTEPQQQQAALRVMDYLVAKAKAEKR
jgi:thiol:disulfide interchange protein DsbA